MLAASGLESFLIAREMASSDWSMREITLLAASTISGRFLLLSWNSAQETFDVIDTSSVQCIPMGNIYGKWWKSMIIFKCTWSWLEENQSKRGITSTMIIWFNCSGPLQFNQISEMTIICMVLTESPILGYYASVVSIALQEPFDGIVK